MNAKTKVAIAAALVIVGLFAYRTGRIDGNDARDAYHLKNDLRGTISLICESNIADNPRNRNVFVDLNDQVIQYSPELHIKYDSQSVFIDKGNSIITLMGDHYYTKITQVGDFARVSIQKNGNFVDSLQCQISKQ